MNNNCKYFLFLSIILTLVIISIELEIKVKMLINMKISKKILDHNVLQNKKDILDSKIL